MTDIDVTAYGAKGDDSTDDSAAVNRAVLTLKDMLKNVGGQQNVCPGNLYFPPGGVYKLNSSINLQNILAYGWGIKASGAVIKGACPGRTVFDLMGSAYGNLDGITMIGDPGNVPAVGLQFGRMTHNQMPAGGHNVTNLKMDGNFTRTGVYNAAGEGMVFNNPIIHNQDTGGGAHCLMIDGAHHYEPITDFQQTAWPRDVQDSCIQHTYINTDFINQKGTPIWISNADYVYFTGANYGVSFDAPIIEYAFMGGKQVAIGLNFDLHAETFDATDYILFSSPQALRNPQVLKLKIHDNAPQCKNLVRASSSISGLGIQYADFFYTGMENRTIFKGDVSWFWRNFNNHITPNWTNAASA